MPETSSDERREVEDDDAARQAGEDVQPEKPADSRRRKRVGRTARRPARRLAIGHDSSVGSGRHLQLGPSPRGQTSLKR